MNGKGDRFRTTSTEHFRGNWDACFGPKCTKCGKPVRVDDDAEIDLENQQVKHKDCQ